MTALINSSFFRLRPGVSYSRFFHVISFILSLSRVSDATLLHSRGHLFGTPIHVIILIRLSPFLWCIATYLVQTSDLVSRCSLHWALIYMPLRDCCFSHFNITTSFQCLSVG